LKDWKQHKEPYFFPLGDWWKRP